MCMYVYICYITSEIWCNLLYVRLHELAVRTEELEESVEQFHSQLVTAENNQRAAAEHSQKADQAWRHFEVRILMDNVL